MPTFRHNELSFGAPEGWEDFSQVILLAPAKGGAFRSNLVVSLELVPRGDTVQAFAGRKLAELKAGVNGLRITQDGPAKFGTLSGILREFVAASPTGQLSQFQFYVLAGPKAYTFTFTDLPSAFPKSRQTAEALLATVALKG